MLGLQLTTVVTYSMIGLQNIWKKIYNVLQSSSKWVNKSLKITEQLHEMKISMKYCSKVVHLCISIYYPADYVFISLRF